MDKRRVLRIPVDWEVSLRHGKQVIHGRALQFSEFGMMVGPADVAQVGKRYEVTFALPGHRSQFRMRGFVVYGTAKGVGVRFESVPPEVTASFRQFVQSEIAGKPAS